MAKKWRLLHLFGQQWTDDLLRERVRRRVRLRHLHRLTSAQTIATRDRTGLPTLDQSTPFGGRDVRPYWRGLREPFGFRPGEGDARDEFGGVGGEPMVDGGERGRGGGGLVGVPEVGHGADGQLEGLHGVHGRQIGHGEWCSNLHGTLEGQISWLEATGKNSKLHVASVAPSTHRLKRCHHRIVEPPVFRKSTSHWSAWLKSYFDSSFDFSPLPFSLLIHRGNFEDADTESSTRRKKTRNNEKGKMSFRLKTSVDAFSVCGVCSSNFHWWQNCR